MSAACRVAPAVVADADYGTTAGFRTALERMGLRYAVAVRGLLKAWAPGASTAETLEAMGQGLPASAWRRVRWGHGTKGPLVARFAARRVRLRHGGGERWALFERSLADDTRTYYVLNLDAKASRKQLVRLARSRWPIEQQYRELKDELGLDHFEGRTSRPRIRATGAVPLHELRRRFLHPRGHEAARRPREGWPR